MSFSQHLKIKNLGPIKECDLNLDRMMVLAGPQAAGKSTIAKTIFFFRSIKNGLLDALSNPYANPVMQSELQYRLLKNFKRLFGENLDENISVEFEYTPDVSIKILGNINGGQDIQISKKILSFVGKFWGSKLAHNDMVHISAELEEILNYGKEVIYIPAGRSMLATLSNALSYIFFKLDDRQKSLIDYCISNYIEFITSVKSIFDPESARFHEKLNSDAQKSEWLKEINDRAHHILKGKYVYYEGNEYLRFNSKHTQKDLGIQFASSGQQEVLWILNAIYYYALTDKPTCFIIEEPEAHLYPNTQKEVAEYIVTSLANDNECLITTHSPYILGALNNILDARRLMDKGVDVSKIIDEEKIPLLSNRNVLSAYFVDDGKVSNALDEEFGLIKNELIDDASDDINRVADKLIDAERIFHD